MKVSIMAKPTITIELEEYFCTILDYLRKMHETRDYSNLPTLVERLQIHGNNMEDGLRWYRGSFYDMDKVLKDKKIPEDKKLEKIGAIVKKKLKLNPED